MHTDNQPFNQMVAVRPFKMVDILKLIATTASKMFYFVLILPNSFVTESKKGVCGPNHIYREIDLYSKLIQNDTQNRGSVRAPDYM